MTIFHGIVWFVLWCIMSLVLIVGYLDVNERLEGRHYYGLCQGFILGRLMPMLEHLWPGGMVVFILVPLWIWPGLALSLVLYHSRSKPKRPKAAF